MAFFRLEVAAKRESITGAEAESNLNLLAPRSIQQMNQRAETEEEERNTEWSFFGIWILDCSDSDSVMIVSNVHVDEGKKVAGGHK